MYKNCRILNKTTGQISYDQIDTEFIGKDFYELVEIPDDGKIYKWDGKQAVEDKDKEQQIAKEKNNSEIQSQIDDLEKQQARALREMVVAPNDFAKNKLKDTDNKINELRKKLIQ